VLGRGSEEPGAVVPDPVAFGVLFEQGDEEGEVFFYEEGDFALGGGEIVVGGGRGFFRRWRCGGVELALEDVEKEAPAVVPYAVVLRVLLEEGGGELEGCVGEVLGVDLDVLVSMC